MGANEMPKVLTSPVERWPGTVVLPDYFNFGQLMAWDHAMLAAQEVIERSGTWTEVDKVLLSGFLACVTEWKLSSFPESVSVETFPAHPRKARRKLFSWLTDEITRAIAEGDEVPNA